MDGDMCDEPLDLILSYWQKPWPYFDRMYVYSSNSYKLSVTRSLNPIKNKKFINILLVKMFLQYGTLDMKVIRHINLGEKPNVSMM